MEDTIHDLALAAERDDEFAAAAEGYVALAAYTIAAADYEVGRSYRQGVAYAVLAMSLDACAGNTSRAGRHATWFGDCIDRIASQADEEVARGLGFEWRGDAALFAGRYEDALVAYDEAHAQFEALSLETQLHWGALPEYDVSVRASERFFADEGVDYFEDHDVDFAGRVRWKRETVRDLQS